jgi:hypothetical protein
MKALTQAQVDSYHHNGFLSPIPALTPQANRLKGGGSFRHG